MQILIEAGANINTASHVGWTPLHTAAEKGYTELVKVGIAPLVGWSLFRTIGKQILVDAGADVDVFDQRSRTPFHTAAIAGHVQIAKVRISP